MEGLTIPAVLLDVVLVLISSGVTFLSVAGIKGIGKAFGKDFSKPAKAIAALAVAAVTTFFLGTIDIAVAYIPIEFVPVVEALLTLVANWLVAAGIQRESKKRILG